MNMFKKMINYFFDFFKIKKASKRYKKSLGFTVYNTLVKSKNRNYKDIKKPYKRS